MHETIAVEAPALELLEVAFDAPTARSHGDGNPRQGPRSLKWRIAVALMIAIALLGAAIALLRNQAPMAVASPAATLNVTPRPPEGISGFAELYVATYLTAGGNDRSEQLGSFYASAPEAVLNAGNRFVRHVAVVGVQAVGDRTWQLRVAADVLVHDGVGYRADGIHHYLVGVVAAEQGFAATSLPIRVAPPPPAPIAAIEAGTEIADAGLAALVEGFLAAYLAGNGDLRGFVAPGALITAVAPAPFTAVTVDELSALAVDASSVRVHVLATGNAPTGDLRLEYHLIAGHDDGVWRVDAVTTTPSLPAEMMVPGS